jgi:hypothetical protein
MESRQLYNAAEHLSQIVSWDKEWIHFGTGREVKFDFIEKLINTFLIDDHLNLVCKRTDSGTFSKIEIMKKIGVLLGQDNFQLWNNTMDKVIAFNRIGVLRHGKR